MSYSRWLTSTWYTFWANCNSSEKETQLFEICPYVTLTYKEIKEDIESTIKKVKRTMLEQHQRQSFIFATHPDHFSDEDWEELKGYMRQFLKDVESDTSLT